MPLEHRRTIDPKPNLLSSRFVVDKNHPWLKTLSKILQGKDIGDHHYLYGSTYPLYYEVGAALKPKSILEIGVRFGYSLASLSSGAGITANIFGIDFESYAINSVAIATNSLKSLGVTANIMYGDSHLFDVEKKFGRKYFDLIHIDGDHSTNGALIDIAKYSKYTNKILVDDITDARVWHAVAAFVASKDDPVSVSYIHSATGFVLIEY
jgi:hypothetical protein